MNKKLKFEISGHHFANLFISDMLCEFCENYENPHAANCNMNQCYNECEDYKIFKRLDLVKRSSIFKDNILRGDDNE